MSQILLEAFNSIPYPTERTEKNGMMDISYTFEDETNHSFRFHFEKRVNYGRNVFVLTLGQKSPNIKMYKRVFGKFHNPLRVIATLIDIVKDNRQKRSDVKGLIIEVPEQAFGAHGRLVDKIIKRELRTELKVQDLELSIEEFEKMGLKGVVATVKPYQFDSVFNGKIMKEILDKRNSEGANVIDSKPLPVSNKYVNTSVLKDGQLTIEMKSGAKIIRTKTGTIKATGTDGTDALTAAQKKTIHNLMNTDDPAREIAKKIESWITSGQAKDSLVGQDETNLGANDLNDPSNPLEDARIDITVDEGNESGTAHIVFQHPSETERSGIQDAIAAIVKKVIPQARRADGSQVDDMFSMVVKGGYLTWNDKIEEIATALNDEDAEAVFQPPEVPDHIKALGDTIKQHNETMTYKTKDGLEFDINGRKLTFKKDMNFAAILQYVFGWFNTEFKSIDDKRQFVHQYEDVTQNFINVLQKLSITEAISNKVSEQFDKIISDTHRQLDLSSTMYDRNINATEEVISDYRDFKGIVSILDGGVSVTFYSKTGPFAKRIQEQFGGSEYSVVDDVNILRVNLDGKLNIKEYDARIVGVFLKASDDNYAASTKRSNPVKVFAQGKVTFRPSQTDATLSLTRDVACYLVGMESREHKPTTPSSIRFDGINTLSEFYDLCDALDDYDFEGNFLKAFRCSKYINDAKANGGELKVAKNGKEVSVSIQEDDIFVNLSGMTLPAVDKPFWKEGEDSAFFRTYYMGSKSFNDAMVVLDNFLDKELSEATGSEIAGSVDTAEQKFHFEHQKGGFKIVTTYPLATMLLLNDLQLDLTDNKDGSVYVKLSHFSKTVGTKKQVVNALTAAGYVEGEHVATPGSATSTPKAKLDTSDAKPIRIDLQIEDAYERTYTVTVTSTDVTMVNADGVNSKISSLLMSDAKTKLTDALNSGADSSTLKQVLASVLRTHASLKEYNGADVFVGSGARKPKLFNDLTIKLAKQGNLPQKTINVKGDDVFITKLSMSGMYNTEERNLSFLMDSNPLYTSIDNQNAEVKRRLLQLVGSSAERIKSAIESWTDGRIKVESVSGSGVKSEPKTDFSFLLNKDISSDAAEPILKYLKKNIKVGTKKYELNSESGVNYLNKILNRLVSLIPNSNDHSFSIGGNINARKAGGLKVVVNDIHRGGYYDGNTHLAVAVQVGGAYTYGINSAVCKFLKEVFANLTNIGDSLPEGRVFDKHGTNFSTVGVAYTGEEYYSKPAFANVKITAKHLVLSDKMNEGIKEDLTGVAPKVNKVEKSILETAMRQMGIYHSAFGYGGGSFTVTMTEGVVDILPVSGNVIALSKLLGVKLGQDLVQDERGGLRFDIA